MLASKSEDLSSIPGTSMVKERTNSSQLSSHLHRHTDIHTHTNSRPKRQFHKRFSFDFTNFNWISFEILIETL